MLYKYRHIIYTFFGLLFGLAFLSIAIILNPNPDGNPINLTEIGGVFSKGNGKIYASVPSGGDFEVIGADFNSFKTLQGEYSDRQIGFDAKNVYAGNLILNGLNPKTLQSLGNNYYTDGITTYYCDGNSERNPNLSGFEEVLKIYGYNLHLNEKPQAYWYPFKKLPLGKIYHSGSGFAIAVDDKNAFYRGEILPNANAKTVKPIRKENDRETLDYFTDGNNLYYHNTLLETKYNSSVYEISIEGDVPGRNTYLVDNQSGIVYVDGISFDKENAPYKLISSNLKHAYQVLFIAKNGIYYFDDEDKKVKKAGENPFTEGFAEISPDVFLSGGKIFYLQAIVNGSGKSGPKDRRTILRQLTVDAAQSFEKVKAISYGSIWKSGSNYYLLNDLGSSQLMPSAIYKFKNPQEAHKLMNAQSVRTDDIRNLADSGAFAEPENIKVATAKTDSVNSNSEAFLWICGIGAVIMVIGFLLANKFKLKPFIIKDNYFIINNLLFSKYLIDDIDRIEFWLVEPGYKSPGYKARFKVFLKNGKTSRFILMTEEQIFKNYSKDEMRFYVKELQNFLLQNNIESILN